MNSIATDYLSYPVVNLLKWFMTESFSQNLSDFKICKGARTSVKTTGTTYNDPPPVILIQVESSLLFCWRHYFSSLEWYYVYSRPGKEKPTFDSWFWSNPDLLLIQYKSDSSLKIRMCEWTNLSLVRIVEVYVFVSVPWKTKCDLLLTTKINTGI